MKVFRFAIIILVLVRIANTHAQTLSGESVISVLTLGPDQAELYSAFGHSAIRVTDPISNISRIDLPGNASFACLAKDGPTFRINPCRST